MIPYKAKILAIARRWGSKATTDAGLIRYVARSPYLLLPSPTHPRPRDPIAAWLRRTPQDRARILARMRIAPPPQGPIATWAGVSAPEIVIIPGDKATIRNDSTSYGFRWRGQWKTAPGSYIHAVHRVTVTTAFCRTMNWLHNTVPRTINGIRTWRERKPLVSRHGIKVYRATWREARNEPFDGVVITARGHQPQHIRRQATIRQDIREAVKTWKTQRRAAIDKQQQLERLKNERTRVRLEDAVAAGFCPDGVQLWARRQRISAARATAGLPIGVIARKGWTDDPRVMQVIQHTLTTRHNTQTPPQ